jgi:hyaluronan synthase
MCILIVALRVGWHLGYVITQHQYVWLLPLWGVTLGLPVSTLFLSWLDTPYTTTPRQQQQLDTLKVAVVVPVYNEDPGMLDRCIYSLVNSSRPPQWVSVTEDGPSGDYNVLREHWTSITGPTEVIWTKSPVNGGKKYAQMVSFQKCPQADILITVDSDTVLSASAIDEGLKPLADPAIASVAGIEWVYNRDKNWLTRTCNVRNTVSQLIAWSTQSVFGSVLINRGTFAVYRAHIIREIVPAYLNETFLGHPIKLGDDSALTLFSNDKGRTVQQVSAFCLPIYPENLSHHWRQWLRWSRGGTVRNFWRLRYLPLSSWGWWWVAIGIYFAISSMVTPVIIAVYWPNSAPTLLYMGLYMLTWAYALAPRVLAIRCSGESKFYRLCSVLLYPFGIFWTFVVLRPVRVYGMFTCLKQGWVTRQAGVEVAAED